MFNLRKTRREAKHERWVPPRDEDVPEDLRQQHQFHKDKIRGRLDLGAGPLPANGMDILTTEALRYVAKMFQKSPDDPSLVSLRNVMGKYYSYLEQFDPEYLQHMKNLVDDIVRDPERAKRIIDQVVAPKVQPQQSQAPMPQAGPESPAGELGSLVNKVPLGFNASKRRLLSKEANGCLYLKRPQNSKFLFKDTIAGKILAGLAQYVRSDGANCVLAISDDEVSVCRTSAIAKVATRIHEEMPTSLWKEISSFLDGKDVDDAEYVSRLIVDEYLDKGTFDLRPVAIRLKGCALGILLYEGVPVPLLPEIEELQKVIGKAMAPFVDSLKSALSMEGLDFTEKTTEEEPDSSSSSRYPTRNPSLISDDKINKSLDMASLVMTAASPKSDRRTRKMALDRIVHVIARHPEAYSQQELSLEDMHVLGRANDEDLENRLARVAKFVKTFEQDDDYLLRTFAESGPADRFLLASMAAKQGRKDAIRLKPDMCIVKAADGDHVNTDAISCLDAQDMSSLDVITKALDMANKGKVQNDRPVLDKAAEAILATRDDNLLKMALKSSSFLPYLSIALLACEGNAEATVGALHGISPRTGLGGRAKALAMGAIVKGLGDNSEVVKYASKVLGQSPSKIGRLAGRELALDYMKIARLDWDGTPIPSPSKIYALGDDPLSLAKIYRRLAVEGDDDALAGLQKLFHLAIQERDQTPELTYLLKFLKEALAETGQNERTLEALSPSPLATTEASVLPDGSLLVKKGGIYVVDDMAFVANSRDAKLIAIQELSGQGKTLQKS